MFSIAILFLYGITQLAGALTRAAYRWYADEEDTPVEWPEEYADWPVYN